MHVYLDDRLIYCKGMNVLVESFSLEPVKGLRIKHYLNQIAPMLYIRENICCVSRLCVSLRLARKK